MELPLDKKNFANRQASDYLNSSDIPDSRPRVEQPIQPRPEAPPAESEQKTEATGPGVQPADEAGTIDKAIEGLKGLLRKPKKSIPILPQLKDTITMHVEKIMQENLEGAYRALDAVHQQEFKIKGEETARAIRHLLTKTRVRIKKIFRLILEWLSILPGINRFYLEQEAKIKADKILALKYYVKKDDK